MSDECPKKSIDKKDAAYAHHISAGDEDGLVLAAKFHHVRRTEIHHGRLHFLVFC